MKLDLTKKEWETMKVIWEIGGRPSVRQVLEYAYPNKAKAYTTIQTIMNILVEKGYLTKVKKGLVNFYKPAFSKDIFVKGETNNFVHKVFNGSFLALANHLVSSDDLSEDEVEKLRMILKNRSISDHGEAKND